MRDSIKKGGKLRGRDVNDTPTEREIILWNSSFDLLYSIVCGRQLQAAAVTFALYQHI